MPHYRTIWLSDLHLGTTACKSEELHQFLKNNSSDILYLNGDIIDILAMKRKRYWPQSHNLIIQKFLKISRKGTKIRYSIGNHDYYIRSLLDDASGVAELGDIDIANEFIHTTNKNKKILVIHGDSFDGAIRMFPLIYYIGDKMYDFIVYINTIYNWFRKRFGYNYWSLAGYLKSKVKGAISFVNNFEKLIIGEAYKRGVDGIFLGHLHSPALKVIEGIIYGNDGDGVDNLTALVEEEDGTIKLIRWTGEVLETL
jgi:UDP-2,3-diacylglucosamine pyrophosphatase LpxH